VRADRLLSLLLLLQHRGRLSASELAEELEVSPRTVLRDVEALSAAGVPVYAERGRHGGFALVPGYSTDLTGLTHDEALALLVAGSRGDGAGMAPALASAMRKVVAGLPAAQRESAGRDAGRILLHGETWLPRDRHGADPSDEERLAVVRGAVFAGRRLDIRYAAREKEPRWRTVDPVGLVNAGAAGTCSPCATGRSAPTGSRGCGRSASATSPRRGRRTSTSIGCGATTGRPSRRPGRR
jgi:predicted DNA-binding transcriptional regulator YafY